MHDSGEPQEGVVDAEPVELIRVKPATLGWREARYPDSTEDPMCLEILNAIMEGRGAFGRKCAELGLPVTTVRFWAVRDTPPGFRAAYKEARRVEMDGFSDEITEIADAKHRDDGSKDTAGAVYRDQLRIKTRQMLMERLNPQDFGDRGTVDDSGKPVPRQQIVIAGQTITF